MGADGATKPQPSDWCPLPSGVRGDIVHKLKVQHLHMDNICLSRIDVLSVFGVGTLLCHRPRVDH